MMRQTTYTNKEGTFEYGSPLQINLYKAKGYSALGYTFKFDISHNNAVAIPTTVKAIEFIAGAIDKVTFEAGTGSDLIDLSITEHMIRQLLTRGELIYDIDRTVGDNKKSTFEVIIDFMSLRFQSPKDTILRELGRFDHYLVEFKGRKTGSIENVTFTNNHVRVVELLKMDVKPVTAIIDGKKVALKSQFKKPIAQRVDLSSRSDLPIDAPKNMKISKIYFWVTNNAGVIQEAQHIKNFILKSPRRNILDIDSPTLIKWNRETLKQTNNSNFNGLYVLDLAGGQYTECLDTNTEEERDSEIILDVDKLGIDGGHINYILETVINL